MIAAAKKSGVLLSTYHNRHWDSQIVQAISQLDDYDTQVLRHRQKHLSQVLCLRMLRAAARFCRLPAD